MTNTTGCNGWKNYETWAFALWLDNEEGTQREMRHLARQIKTDASEHENVPEIWSEERAAVYLLAEALKSLAEDSVPDLGNTVWADLLSSALSEVN
jgi:hypothetical protein